MRPLEQIVKSSVSYVSDIEDRVVNFPYASGFAVSHPLLSSLASGSVVFSLRLFPDVIAAVYGYLPGISYGLIPSLAIPPVAAALTGAYVYGLAKSHRILDDAGLSVENIYQSTKSSNVRDDMFRVGGAAAATSGVLVLGNFIGSMREIPGETLVQLSAAGAPFVYGSARRIINDLRTSKMSISDRAKLLFSGLTGNRKMMADVFRKLAGADPSFENLAALSDAYLMEGKLDEGVIGLRDALHAPEKGVSGVRATRKIWETAAAYTATESSKRTHADYLYVARTAQSSGSPEISKRIIRRLAGELPGIESDILAAIFLELSGDPEAYHHWNSAAAEVFRDERLRAFPVSERGIHNTRRYGPTPLISGTFVFKESSAYEEMEFEKSALSYVNSILPDPYFTVPRVIAEFTHSNGRVTYDLVLRYLEGMSPAEMQRKGTLTKEDLLSVITYLAWIHKNVPPGMSRKGPVDFEAKSNQILANPHLELPYRVRENIETRIHSILHGQKQSPFVIGKDPHPSQWRFGRDYLAALDWEDVGSTSMFVDGAKFYVHPDLTLGAELMDGLHGEAARLYDANGLFTKESEFRIRMLDAMLYQSLSFVSAWSSPGMEHVKHRRAEVLASAGEAFRMLKNNHPRHYLLNRLDYDSLEDSFRETRDILTA